MKKERVKPTIINLSAIIAIFVFFYAIFWWLGPYSFIYQEHLVTFYYDWPLMLETLNKPGGFCEIVAEFLIQFFVYPQAGMLITAALLTLIALFTARILKVIYGNNILAPIALLPPVTITVLHYNINYMYSGTVAMLIMVIVLSTIFTRKGTLRFSDIRLRILYTMLCTVVLYTTCGAIALLYAILMVVIAVFKNPRQSANYLLLPLIVFILGYISVRVGEISDNSHALLPDAYFTHRLVASSYVYTPWYTMLGVIALGCLMSLYSVRSLWLKRVIQGVCILAVVVTGSTLTLTVNRDNETFKRLNVMARTQQWDDIIDINAKQPLNNLVNQNILNIALAEKGALADSLFHQPCIDIRNIYITGDSSPYMYMLLSDVYYSMGHIALARRHAFEANEALGNESPRMLQRLVDTNIAFGDYKVAKKYIKRLERTAFYRDWAKQRRAMLNDAAVSADSLLSLKRACIFPDNRFSAIYGLDDDLLQIARNAPEHKPTLQYLGSLYLLSHDVPKMIDVVDEFRGSDALASPLPLAFQEGIVVAYADDSIRSSYGIDASVIERYEQFRKRPELHRDNAWYFLRFIK